MADKHLSFDTSNPKYQEVKQELNKASRLDQDKYTDKSDKVAAKKINKLASEDT